jgi:hypothetical protein
MRCVFFKSLLLEEFLIRVTIFLNQITQLRATRMGKMLDLGLNQTLASRKAVYELSKVEWEYNSTQAAREIAERQLEEFGAGGAAVIGLG